MKYRFLLCIFPVLLIACQSHECGEICTIQNLVLPADGAQVSEMQGFSDDWGVGISIYASADPGPNSIWITDRLCSGMPGYILDGLGGCPLTTMNARGICSPLDPGDVWRGHTINSVLIIDKHQYDEKIKEERRYVFSHEMGHCIGFIHSADLARVMSDVSPRWWVTEDERKVAQDVYINGGGLAAALASGRMLFVNDSDLKFTLVTQ